MRLPFFLYVPAKLMDRVLVKLGRAMARRLGLWWLVDAPTGSVAADWLVTIGGLSTGALLGACVMLSGGDGGFWQLFSWWALEFVFLVAVVVLALGWLCHAAVGIAEFMDDDRP